MKSLTTRPSRLISPTFVNDSRNLTLMLLSFNCLSTQ
jgi:hypothetical protein